MTGNGRWWSCFPWSCDEINPNGNKVECKSEGLQWDVKVQKVLDVPISVFGKWFCKILNMNWWSSKCGTVAPQAALVAVGGGPHAPGLTLWLPFCSRPERPGDRETVFGCKRDSLGKGLEPHFLPPCSKPSKQLPQEHYHTCFQWSFDECSLVAGYKKLEAHPSKTSVMCGSTLKYISSEVFLYERNNLYWYWIPSVTCIPFLLPLPSSGKPPACLLHCGHAWLLSGVPVLSRSFPLFSTLLGNAPLLRTTQSLSIALERNFTVFTRARKPRVICCLRTRFVWYQFPSHLLLFRPQAFLPFPDGPVHSLTTGPCTCRSLWNVPYPHLIILQPLNLGNLLSIL